MSCQDFRLVVNLDLSDIKDCWSSYVTMNFNWNMTSKEWVPILRNQPSNVPNMVNAEKLAFIGYRFIFI